MFEKFNNVQQHCLKGALVGIIALILNIVALNVVNNFFVWFICLLLGSFFGGVALVSAIYVRAFRYFQDE